jgi:hypothetical protein
LKKGTYAALLAKRKSRTKEDVTISKDNNCHSCHNKATVYLDGDIEDVCAGLQPEYSKCLSSISEENALTISNYIKTMRTKINLSDSYRKDTVKLLCIFSKFNNDKSFMVVIRTDILAFLNSFRRTETIDPMHRWIGTYNIYRTPLVRFFKWLYFPDIELSKRHSQNYSKYTSARKKGKDIIAIHY